MAASSARIGSTYGIFFYPCTLNLSFTLYVILLRSLSYILQSESRRSTCDLVIGIDRSETERYRTNDGSRVAFLVKTWPSKIEMRKSKVLVPTTKATAYLGTLFLRSVIGLRLGHRWTGQTSSMAPVTLEAQIRMRSHGVLLSPLGYLEP